MLLIVLLLFPITFGLGLATLITLFFIVPVMYRLIYAHTN